MKCTARSMLQVAQNLSLLTLMRLLCTNTPPSTSRPVDRPGIHKPGIGLNYTQFLWRGRILSNFKPFLLTAFLAVMFCVMTSDRVRLSRLYLHYGLVSFQHIAISSILKTGSLHPCLCQQDSHNPDKSGLRAPLHHSPRDPFAVAAFLKLQVP